MDTTPKYNLPWEIISDSFTGNLSDDAKLQLEQWLASDPAHQQQYHKLADLWKHGMEEYELYKTIDAHGAWDTFKKRLPKENTKSPLITSNRFFQKKYGLKPLMAIAAVFTGIIVLGIWLLEMKAKPEVYETTSNISRQIILNDGSVITLNPRTKIEVSRDFNKLARTITMISGDASFKVLHQLTKPFIVKLGLTQIEDLGTSFTIVKNEKKVKVSVSSGKVSFTKLDNWESRQLTAGLSITFDIAGKRFEEIKSDSTASDAKGKLLNFENTPLAQVIIRMQQVYGKKVVLTDKQIADKKITAHLSGMSYIDALDVICRTLKLEYSIADSVTMLKAANIIRP